MIPPTGLPGGMVGPWVFLTFLAVTGLARLAYAVDETVDRLRAGTLPVEGVG